MQRIEELNELDMELYDYARDLFQQRYQYTRQQERRQQRIKNHLQQQSRQGLGVNLWPSHGRLSSAPEDGEREDGVEGEEGGGRTEEVAAAAGTGAVANRLPTEDYMNQIINRW